ncbi:QacE family quaternary ammonium compound efflux SMR transporter [Oceanobacillus piezotolerans]|uniref:QacE family quaternary ammonium compound efflux SMR transporter n=1 Tax=Oceanobacillus piezotolerans TaxID=2448030 RepID=A0A498D7P5_9BACI|nr:multidrug efflux SMR transporter [Oceanobacillus piezotolerans]RLL46546.1 QacE family quaternary ammonium compound efflux SMR transporter [Oceanobacillus piezotolerans]
MDWFFLLLAGVGEVTGVIGINKVVQKKNLPSFALLIGGFLFSFLFLTLAMRTIPMGTAYAIWTGIGTAGGAIVGMILFNESRDWRRILFIGMIIASAVGLKLIS